jgi:hypothetical protein
MFNLVAKAVFGVLVMDAALCEPGARLGTEAEAEAEADAED